MATHENRLCRLVVREHFGPIVEKVANVLIRKGRLTVGLISRFTELNPKQVRECLTVMIQHNIGLYAEVTEKGRTSTYYEVNRLEILKRAQLPKVLHYAQEWFGREGASIAQTVLSHGKLTIVECLKYSVGNKASEARTRAIKSTFSRMVKEKCLVLVRPMDSMNPVDRKMAIEQEAIDKEPMPPSAARLLQIRKNIEQTASTETPPNGLKRSVRQVDVDEPGGEKKRMRFDGEVHMVEEAEEDVYFRINFDRFIIRWRNQAIADLMEARLNKTAGSIMAALLSLAEEQMKTCKDQNTSPVNVIQISSKLPTETNLIDTLEQPESTAKPTAGECLDSYITILQDDLLKLTHADAGRSGQVFVHLDKAGAVLKWRLIQHIVEARYGKPYVRIMNMLREKGKLEEKQISKLAMLPIKDVREKLTTLSNFGVLNLQEVPKSADRAPSRTFYLWEVLLDRTVDSFVERLYHTMANLRQRRFVERAKRSVLLEKCERTDVQEDSSLLNSMEKRELEKLQDMLEKLEGQELRIADMVMTLRDF